MNRKETALKRAALLQDVLDKTPWSHDQLVAAIRHECDRVSAGDRERGLSYFNKILGDANAEYRRTYCRFCWDNDVTADLCCDGHEHLIGGIHDPLRKNA